MNSAKEYLKKGQQLTQQGEISQASIAFKKAGDILSKRGKLRTALLVYKSAIRDLTLALNPKFLEQELSDEVIKPDFFIIGVGKGGTSSLYRYVIRHPQILQPLKKEMIFFSDYFDYGIDWYLAHFPPALVQDKSFMTLDASPAYLVHPHAPERLVQTFPNAKLIIILRNPVERSISAAYSGGQLKSRETRNLSSFFDFEKAINSELQFLENFNSSILTKDDIQEIIYGKKITKTIKTTKYLLSGLYIFFIEKWMSLFPKEQFLILRSEDFYSNPSTVMKQVFDFLDLPNHQLSDYKQYNAGSYKPMDENLYQKLSDFFKPYNQMLEEYLGMNFNWD